MNNFTAWAETTRAGNYVVRYYDGTKLPNGKLKRFPYQQIDKDECGTINGKRLKGRKYAEALAIQLKENHTLDKFHIVDSVLSLNKVIEKFMNEAHSRHQSKELSWTTVLNYEQKCNLILDYFKSLQEMTDLAKIREWKQYLEAKPYAQTSVYSCLNTLAIVFNWLIKNEFLDKSPFKDGQIMERPKTKPRFWLAHEVVATEKSAGDINHHFQIGFHLAHDAGLRLVEMVGDGRERFEGVLWEDLIWNEDGTVDLLIRAEVTKGRKKDRIVRLPPELIELLGSRKTGPLVPMTRDQFHYKMKKAKAQADIKQKRTTHGLRHTLGTNFIESGGDIRALQEILGHDDLKTTMIYSNVRQKYVAAQMEKSHAHTRKQLAIAKTLQDKQTSFLPNLVETDGSQHKQMEDTIDTKSSENSK